MKTINKQFTKEQFAIYLKGYLKGIDEMNQAFKKIAEVAEEMDGKVLNKRFTDKVDEVISPYAYCGSIRKDYSGKVDKFEVYLHNRSVQIPKEIWGRESNICVYFDSDLAHTYYFMWGGVTEDGRVNAEQFKEGCERVIESNKKEARKSKEALERWDENLKALKDIEQMIRDAAPGINPLFLGSELGDSWYWTLRDEVMKNWE